MDLRIAAADAAALLGEIGPDSDLAEAFARARIEGLFLVLDIDADGGADLLVASMQAAVMAPERAARRRFERLAAKIRAQLDRHGILIAMDPERPPDPRGAYNDTPQDELGGFTPAQMHDLLYRDWAPDGRGLRLRPAGGLDEVDGSDVLHNARILLAALADGGTRATPKGNFNRAFVGGMIEAMRWPAGYVEQLHDFNKVINEGDDRRLHELRIVLQVAKLIAVRKGRVVATRRGRELAAPGRAADLHERLVWTTFREFNLSYGDRFLDVPEFQLLIAFPLAVLCRLDRNWHPFADLVPRLLLPAIVDLLPPPRVDAWNDRAYLVRWRLIEPLRDLGLLECRREDARRPHLRGITGVRKTPLFDRVFSLGCDGSG